MDLFSWTISMVKKPLFGYNFVRFFVVATCYNYKICLISLKNTSFLRLKSPTKQVLPKKHLFSCLPMWAGKKKDVVMRRFKT